MQKRIVFPIFLCVLLVAQTTTAVAASYGSRRSGSWAGTTTWYLLRSGTVSVTSGSMTVSGTGTLFTTQLVVGDTIVLHSSPKPAIGRVATIGSNTSLTLSAAASFTGSGAYGRYTNASPGTNDNATVNAGDSVAVTGSATTASLTIKSGGVFSIANLVGLTLTGNLVLDGTWRGTGNLHIAGFPATTAGAGKSLDAGTLWINQNSTDSVLAGTSLDLSTASINIQKRATLVNSGSVKASDIAGSFGSSAWINDINSSVSIGNTFMSVGTLTASASGNTVIYNGLAQTVTNATYNNLTLAGSDSKTLGAVTVNGTLSLQGTATASAAPTYGASAVLEYKGNSQQTTGPEFLASMTKNVFINNSSGVVLGGAKSVTGTLTFVAGNLILGANNLTLTGTVSGAGATKAIVTNSTGGVVRNISGGSSVQFPLSTDGTDYNPVGISLTMMDPADNFTVRIAQGVSPAAPNNQCAVLRTWTITEGTPGGNNAALTFQWDASQEGTSFTRSSAGIWQYNGSAWTEVGTNSVSGSGPYTLSLVGFIATSFGPFIVGNDGALPITLSSFTAVENGRNLVILNWATISEVDNYGFEVERSTSPNGPFNVISPLIPGHGTTTVAQHYSFADGGSLTGTVYYRLKQTDLDKTIRYSDRIMVNKKGDATALGQGFALGQNYPNPFNPSTEIRFSVSHPGPARVQVINTLGQLVATLFNETAEPGREYVVPFNGSGLASGMYFYRLNSGEKTELRKMLIVR